MEIAKFLKAARKRKGLTQERTAVLAGITLRRYQALESGENDNPKIKTLAAVYKPLGLKLETRKV